MMIRFEVIASENSVAGTAFSDSAICAKKGQELVVDILFDTMHIAPGSYCLDMLAFEVNDFGVQDWVDRIGGAAQIEIFKRSENDTDWLPQWWGHTKLHDIRITNVKHIG